MSLNEMMLRKLKSGIKLHGYHYIFGISILSLTALLAWWSVFIHNSISQQRIHRYDQLTSNLKYLSLKLGSDKLRTPALGILREDTRFEIVSCEKVEDDFSRRLEPFWPGFCLRPQPALIEQIEAKSNRLNFMLVGEAAVFLVIILVCSVFLYQYIRLERRTAHEVRRFWERSAHEIKTPITGIKAFLQNLKNRSLNLDELEPYVELALKQVKKQEKLAENILSGSRLESKEGSLTLERINIGEFLVVYFKEDTPGLTDLKVRLDFDRNAVISVMASSQALRVILENLADNAVKYASPEPELKVEILKVKNKAVLTFQDNGPGFSPALAQNMFQAYKHSDEELPAKRQGTGMGLYISRQLARSMGGDLIAVSPGRGRGAIFRIHLNTA